MHPSIVRQVHASRIFHAIRLKPLLSQRELVAESGTDKSTVSAIVKQFEARGLVERDRGTGQGRVGRPGERIRISARSGVVVGVNLRPDGCEVAAAGLDGAPLAQRRGPTPDRRAGLGAMLSGEIGALLEALGRPWQDVLAVGVALPGLVNRDGAVAQSPNLGWGTLDLRAELAPFIARPLFIDNNTNAAAMAEGLFGAAIGHADFIYVESGSGVGAGIVLNGEVLRGASGYGGEVGHMKIVPGGRLCRCGGAGCLSAYVSNLSILERLARRAGAVGGAAPGSMAEGEARAAGGEAEVLVGRAEGGRHLGIGLANIINIFNPPLILLGGGAGMLLPWMRGAMEQALAEQALVAARMDCRLAPAAMPALSGCWGGLALALEGCTRFDAAEHVPW